MNCKPTSVVLSSVERTDRLVASEKTLQPTSSQPVREDWDKDSKKANAKFQLDSSEISTEGSLGEDVLRFRSGQWIEA